MAPGLVVAQKKSPSFYAYVQHELTSYRMASGDTHIYPSSTVTFVVTIAQSSSSSINIYSQFHLQMFYEIVSRNRCRWIRLFSNWFQHTFGHSHSTYLKCFMFLKLFNRNVVQMISVDLNDESVRVSNEILWAQLSISMIVSLVIFSSRKINAKKKPK